MSHSGQDRYPHVPIPSQQIRDHEADQTTSVPLSERWSDIRKGVLRKGTHMEGRVALRAVVRHCRPRVSLEQHIDVPTRLGDLLNDAAKRLVVK